MQPAQYDIERLHCMETVLAFGVVLTLLPIAWYFIRWFFSSVDYKRGFRNRLLVSIGLFVLFLIGYGNVLDSEETRVAQDLGFENLGEYREAKQNNIGSSEAWQQHKDAVQAAMVADQERMAAEAAAKAKEDAAKVAAREREASALRAAEEERRKQDEAAVLIAEADKREQCRKDLQCSWNEASIDLAVDCRRAIEGLAKWDYEWTDGWTEPAFAPAGWQDEENGVLMAIGKSLKLQNGFGAWKHVAYLCAYDPALKKVVDVSVF